jgi:thermostable 8-oxoguanine DNA glycosylase
LFKESCSNYVYRTAKEEGLMKGLSALKYRYNNCRPNYYLMKDKDKTVLITAKYVIIEENLIDERILLKNKEKL